MAQIVTARTFPPAVLQRLSIAVTALLVLINVPVAAGLVTVNAPWLASINLGLGLTYAALTAVGFRVDAHSSPPPPPVGGYGAPAWETTTK